MRLTHHDRFPYRPIRGRQTYAWPGGRRLAVYVALNLEHFSFGDGLGATLAGQNHPPDVMNFAWREYGNRVGAWRLLDLFDTLGLPAAALLNSALADHAPELVAACVARGDEIVGHGRSNAEAQGVLDEAAERALIDEATAALTAATGTRPQGWLGPWISESRVTPDLLKEAGYGYVLDWCMDDQPVPLATRAGPLLAVPYPQELNDIPAIVGRRVGGEGFADMIVAQFDEMLEQAETGPLVMGIALHAYLVGQPHRLRPLRRALAHVAATRDAVWLTTPGAIATHCAGLSAGILPA